MLKEKSGFTLIELLLVIALIGILAFTAMTSFNGSKSKQAVDAESRQLMSDLLSVQSQAMNNGENYYVDPNTSAIKYPFIIIRIWQNPPSGNPRYEIREITGSRSEDDYPVSTHVFGNSVIAYGDDSASFYDYAFSLDGELYYRTTGSFAKQGTTITVHLNNITPDFCKYVVIDSVGRIRISNTHP